MGGWIGGTLGTAIGLMIALVAFLFRKGTSRKLITAILLVVIVIGAVCLVAGVIAAVNSQPYAVYYPSLLAGVLATAFALAGCVKLRRQRREIELRKMQAMDT